MRVVHCVGRLVWVVGLISGVFSSEAKTWSGSGANNNANNPTNWVGGVGPVAGDDIVLDTTTNKNLTWNTNITLHSWTQIGYGGTVTVATVFGTVGFTNLTILGDCTISNGVWTQTANPAVNYETNRLSVSIGGNLIIGPNAIMDVTAKGYTSSRGPGYTSTYYSGCYGGSAGPGSGYCYGSITSPTNLGSGGLDQAGGGAIRLTVVSNLCNDGLVCADGSYLTSRTGSGGSIWLTAGTLTGGGVFRANGGNTTYPGGGGRIALILKDTGAVFTNFSGSILALAGGSAAGAGTVYLETSGDVPGKGQLVINNAGGSASYGGFTDLNGTAAVTCEFSRITLTNGGNLSIGSDDTLVATNTMLVGGSLTTLSNGIWVAGGRLLVLPVFACSNIFIGISATGATFNPSTSFTIGSNAEFRVDKPHTMTCDLIVAGGGKMTHTANGGAELYKMDLTLAGSLNVQSGGSVDVTAKGYVMNSGPGKPGGHGGRGSSASGSCYGSIVAPTNCGSGYDVSGGGVIRLMVSSTVSNNGLVCADGSSANNGKGAGGSIWLTAGMLAGSGVFRANGGGTTYPGGGGRIALVLTNAGAVFTNFSGSIQALGGGAAAGAGTVYLRTTAQGLNEGILILDNSNVTTTGYTEIGSNVTDAAVGDLFIRNGAYLRLLTNQSLTVGGVWSNGANFSAQADSSVFFAGSAGSTSLLYGSSTFMRLYCTNGLAKTLLFQAGKTNTVVAQGRLRLHGSAVTPNLILRSTTDGSAWKLNVSTSADQSVSCVDVKNSDAMTGVGAVIGAVNSVDQGGNTNWTFTTVGAGETNVWTGASSTAWSQGGNWSLARAPIADDNIRIPASLSRYPVLDDHRIVNGLVILPGASLSLAGYNLTVNANATFGGALVASGSETVTLRGDADFTGGSVVPALSTIMIAGNGAQSFNFAGLMFYKVNVQNGVGTVTFNSGFSATELRCEEPSGSLTPGLTFEAGATVTLRDFVMLGSVANTNISLQSSSPGTAWKLVVLAYRLVQGVSVEDSDAGMGLTIAALSSKDNSGNANWTFGVAPTSWLGTSNSNFHTAANWSSATVPGATDRVLVTTNIPMTITGAVTLLELTVGGGTTAAVVTAQAPLTVAQNVVVLSNGTLTLNQPCVVSNGLYVQAGGLLTHSTNTTTEANKLNLTIGGNVVVDPNGRIDVTAKGYAHGAGNGIGPGSRGSYGGCGLDRPGPCYGSIVAPTNFGSSSDDDAGGGAVRLLVGGTVRNDGLICADGAGVSRAGAGGSLWMTCGSLTGTGTLRANGGGANAAGGGRISLVVTNAGADFSSYSGSILALGGGTGAGAGTIYKQRSVDRSGRGSVWVDNSGRMGGYTDVPPYTNYVHGEADRTMFTVTNASILRLTADFAVGDIWVGTNSVLNLGFKTLTVHAKQHALGLGSVTNFGAIVWIPDVEGSVFIIR